MAHRVTSRSMFGRAQPLAALHAAFTEGARLVLVAGDAGIGKTRLVADFCAAVRRDGARTATGGCIQLGEASVAFAPIAEALRDVRASLGDEAFADLVGDGRDALGPLLGATSDRPAHGSGPLFEHLLALLSRLAEPSPFVLVVEDLHWADASTRDLVTFLGRNLRDPRVTVVLTYRPEELHRRHPLRPLLAELDRGTGVERVTLDGLGRDDLAALVAELGGGPADPGDIDALLARTGGNPFYVEEIVASHDLTGAVPAPLADVILARVDRLPESTRRVLGMAAVIGAEIDDGLLAAVCGQPIDSATTALRDAVAHQLLVSDSRSFRFRHALVREALYEDLLPGERERIHTTVADAVADAPGLAPHVRWALVAHHRMAAHRTAAALEASVRAADEALRVYAMADAAAQYERALTLFGSVPDAAERIGMSRPELLVRAADSISQASSAARGVELLRAALAEMPDGTPPEVRAVVTTRVARLLWIMRDGPAGVREQEQAVALLADRPPSPEKALVLATLGQHLMLRDLDRAACDVLRKAIEVAREVGAADVEAHALDTLGVVMVNVGHPGEGVELGRRALAMNLEHDWVTEACRAYLNVAHSLLYAGRYAEAAELGHAGMDYAARKGMMRHYGEAIAGNLLSALIASGRWDEADAVRDDPRLRVAETEPEAYLELRWLRLPLERGDVAAARESIERCRLITAHTNDVQFTAVTRAMAGHLALLEGDFDGARAQFADALERCVGSDDQYYTSWTLALAMRTEADRVAAAHRRDADQEVGAARAVAASLLGEVDALAARTAGQGLPATAAWLATARADHARAHGTDDAAGWAAVATQWDAVGQPYPAACARLHQAAAAARQGDRATATAALATALETADRLGAQPLRKELLRLARRGRLELPDGSLPAAAVDPGAGALTPRELEVLRLVARGLSNRQIGEALFISAKTASVHVTNLLRKLDVTNRTEASAWAHRAGVLDGS